MEVSCRYTPGEIVAGWVGPRADLDVVEKRKILPLVGIEPGPFSPLPVAIPTELSRLHRNINVAN
jgi:hypothetical protein